jgi:glycosyltransferase involved in cell wall biosynthesis
MTETKFQIPTVSVVIPVYNHAHKVRSAIHSVLSQSYQDYELIVVNDGSTDHLIEVLQAFDHIQLIQHAENKGRAAARNSGVLAASGQYIAFLDADDTWMPEKLEKQLGFLDHHPEISICLTGFEFVPARGERRTVRLPKVSSWERYLLKHIGFPDGSIPLISKTCFDEIGLQDTDFVWHENWEWLLRASSHYRIGVLDHILVVKHKGKKRPPAALKESAALQFSEKYKLLFQKYGIYGKSALSLKWFDIAIAFFHERDFQSGRKYLYKAIRTWPFQKAGLYFRIFDSFSGTDTEYILYTIRAKMEKICRPLQKKTLSKLKVSDG